MGGIGMYELLIIVAILAVVGLGVVMVFVVVSLSRRKSHDQARGYDSNHTISQYGAPSALNNPQPPRPSPARQPSPLAPGVYALDDTENKIVIALLRHLQATHRLDLSRDQAALARLRDAAAKAKPELLSRGQVRINLPFITADQSGPKHLDLTITPNDLA
jgi:hypothetical protein